MVLSRTLRKTVFAMIIVFSLIIFNSCTRYTKTDGYDAPIDETYEAESPGISPENPETKTPENTGSNSADEDHNTESDSNNGTIGSSDDDKQDIVSEPSTDITPHTPENSDYILPESNFRRYEYFELFQYFFDHIEAAYARNEILARHGHTFDNEAYKTYFGKQTWYQPKGKVLVEDLNDFEQYNFKLLLFFEKGYQGAYPPGMDFEEVSQDKYRLVKELKSNEEYMVDLNGDGKKDKVSWKSNSGSTATINVNNISINIPDSNSGNWAEYVVIVDIDPSDPYKEIIICDEGPSNDEWSYYYEYRSNKINLIGETAGYYDYSSLRLERGKNVIASTRAQILQTWFFNKTFQLDKNHKLKEVSHDYYNTAYPVFLKEPIHLFEKRDLSSRLYTVDGGQAALISATDNISWCRLTLEDGTEGWFAVENFDNIVKDKVQASEIFDNLCYAD